MEELKKRLEKPEIQYWPELRWWLAEGLHTDETLKKDIDMVYNAGFGAVEFLAMNEEGANSSRYGWGSEEWVHDSRLVIRKASELGMGVSVTSGTNWATANLTTILPDDKTASKELNYSAETMAPGQTRRGPLFKALISQPNVKEQILIGVIAARRLARTYFGAILDPESIVILTDKVKNNCLIWTAPEGEENPNNSLYELVTLWMHGTGQTAVPAQGIAYAINYVDPYGIQALIAYWEKTVLTRDLRELITKNNRVQMYMDSLELRTYGRGGQFFGCTLLDEFKKRRGYDLTPYLPFLLRPYDRSLVVRPVYYYESPDSEMDRRLRTDFFHTLTELYIDNVLKPFQKWLHGAGMTLRAEISYGMPYEISLPGKYVDGIEGESLDFANQPEAFRSFAGMAFLLDKPYSSETGALKENYMKSLSFFNQIIFTQFACGVTRTVLHGYSSICGAENSTCWPGHEGMLPIYAERFNCRQPAWKHYSDWTAMLSRFQMLLRQGKPRRDILILRLDYYFNGALHRLNGIKDSVIYEKLYFRKNNGTYWRDMSLQNWGYTYDYVAPQLLEDEMVSFSNGLISPNGPAYRALVIYQEELPLSSAKKILEWAKQGLSVLLINGVTEMVRNEIYVTHVKAASKSPYNDKLDDELGAVIDEMKKLPNVRTLNDQKETVNVLQDLDIKPYACFDKQNNKIITFTRHDGDLYFLYIYHYLYTEKEPFTFTVKMEGTGKASLINCWNNSITELEKYHNSDGYTQIELNMVPGEAVIVVLETGKEGKPVSRMGTAPETIEITGWDLEVESWDEGEEKEIFEDRGLGYVSKEVYYETRKTLISVGKTDLIPWKDISAVGKEISGIGYYRVSFVTPSGWKNKKEVILKLGSTQGNSVAVYVNGRKAPVLDYLRLETDIVSLLKEGENSLLVEVSSTLNNRLGIRGYYDKIQDPSVMIEGKPRAISWNVQDYGLTGKVTLTAK